MAETIETALELRDGLASSPSEEKTETPKARKTIAAATGGGMERALRRCQNFQSAQATSPKSTAGTPMMSPKCSSRHMVSRLATDQMISAAAMVIQRLLRSGRDANHHISSRPNTKAHTCTTISSER